MPVPSMISTRRNGEHWSGDRDESIVQTTMYVCALTGYVCVSTHVQWNLCSKDTTGATVNSPVQWNLCSKDTTGATENSPVQWNLCSKDTIGTTVNSPVQ